jgi:hypothetical protein
MERKCAVCGQAFAVHDPRKKYCSDRCRKRNQRIPPRLTSGGNRESSRVGEPVVSALVEALRRELKAADRLQSVPGIHAVFLAERLTQRGDTGSATAALSKQFAAVRLEALADVNPAEDPLSLLKRRQGAKQRLVAVGDASRRS